MLKRDEIFSLKSKVCEPCHTPQLGEGYVRIFKTADWLEWKGVVDATPKDEKTGDPVNMDIYLAKLVQLSYCDENGELVFNINDIHKINENLNRATIEQIWVVCCRINALTKQDAWMEVARERENFSRMKANSTSAASPPTSAGSIPSPSVAS